MAKQTQPAKVKEPTLPDSELEVMRVLWRHQKATARQVWTDLQAEGSKWTYATVNTLLQRLEAKGLATSDKSQMTYVFAPKISKQQVVKKRVKQLVDKLYDGQSGSLVMHLLKSQKLSPQEVTEINEILDSARKSS
jgi:BlaI family transcriptional regulator, penicillinase repressor